MEDVLGRWDGVWREGRQILPRYSNRDTANLRTDY